MVIDLSKFTEETDILTCGVYLITHKDTEIKYVGSTKNSFKERWKNHIKALIKEKTNPVLINIYKKYGLEGFRFSILEKITNQEVSYIRQREKYWIEYLDSYKNGANCTLNTESAFYDSNIKTHKYTEEEKIKMRENAPNKKTVYLYDEEGNLIQTFPSTVACDKFLGLEKRRTNWAINHFLRLKKRYYASYELKEWCPKEEKKLKKQEAAVKTAKIRKEKGSYVFTEETKIKERLSHKNRKRVALYDLQGNFIKKFESLNECDDYLNLYRGTTSKVFRGLTKVLKKKYIPKLI